ncbi:sodium-dependent lysophosphatidylcholine symporter 1 [Plakobranchus ocellatus]|uniref:Sodium-dependent lysophosphatidylcholine symporter 1 n=1 Tax=Plakobranchus ocellatus TaxID=259542 RepID=A0AAV4BRP6_9GAST|nr:sodium-dependent lysophosphatidylcholine symporter 1 [Plakobranchus ocellatus]
MSTSAMGSPRQDSPTPGSNQKLQPRYVSVILFTGDIWDAVTDPAIGILVQKTDTRWGKMRPWFTAILSISSHCIHSFVILIRKSALRGINLFDKKSKNLKRRKEEEKEIALSAKYWVLFHYIRHGSGNNRCPPGSVHTRSLCIRHEM